MSTASPPVRRRRIVHKSTACLGLALQLGRLLGRPFVDPAAELGAQRQFLIGSPNGCLGALGFIPVQFACFTRMGV